MKNFHELFHSIHCPKKATNFAVGSYFHLGYLETLCKTTITKKNLVIENRHDSFELNLARRYREENIHKWSTVVTWRIANESKQFCYCNLPKKKMVDALTTRRSIEPSSFILHRRATKFSSLKIKVHKNQRIENDTRRDGEIGFSIILQLKISRIFFDMI